MLRWLLKCQHHNDYYTLLNTQTKYWCSHFAKTNEFYNLKFYKVFISIRLGEEFDEETTDGRKCKTTVTMEGNKLITSQKATGGGKDALAVITILMFLIFYTLQCLGERVLWWRCRDDNHCGWSQLQAGLQEDLMCLLHEDDQRFNPSINIIANKI